MRIRSIIVMLCSLFPLALLAQTGSIKGTVTFNGQVVSGASVYIAELNKGAISNAQGAFELRDMPLGQHTLKVKLVGYKEIVRHITLKQEETLLLNFELTEHENYLQTVVVTGTKTFKRKSNSAVIVQILDTKTLDNLQACNLSEGLKFQPGLRVETNCQTCNYTQLRMNGLAGNYSQILINGRPIFSPLTGLYGLEQIPVNMVERIEVIRGGGSSLYGSSAIGGTVNVITKIPTKNSYGVNYNYQRIQNQTNDRVLNANASILNKKKNAGISLYTNTRHRDMYDHNGDNFSELPLLQNKSIGLGLFYLPKPNQKLEFSASYMEEFRYGGDMLTTTPHLAKQAEERTHHVGMASLDYQINFNQNKSNFIAYAAGQFTNRQHFTGILPDDSLGLEDYKHFPPYGTSKAGTYQGGVQLNHKIAHFIKGSNVFTLGSEFVVDDVFDQIESYAYLIDQSTKNWGTFLQSDWEITPKINLLSGARIDLHNLMQTAVVSPRMSLLYKYNRLTQLRLNYGTGFRAPQAFDTDLHIAFAGGGVSRVSLSPHLQPERSKSLSASFNYDKPKAHFIWGYTLEAFYTHLADAFILQPIGEDSFGYRFEKQNGQAARVGGLTTEIRANFDKKLQIETGLTLQRSEFEKEVEYIDGLEGKKTFMRTPRSYGFSNLTYTPSKQWLANLNVVYTGSMLVPHFAGAENQTRDEYVNTHAFVELNLKCSYTFKKQYFKSQMELYAGSKNITNAYQSYFDAGKNRDSNFIYGPAMPRSFYIGIKLKSI